MAGAALARQLSLMRKLADLLQFSTNTGEFAANVLDIPRDHAQTCAP
jgi:hypothetical protein